MIHPWGLAGISEAGGEIPEPSSMALVGLGLLAAVMAAAELTGS